jgi:hypothetical protein
MSDQSSQPLVILTRQSLAELHDLAIKNGIDIKHLEYREAQQALTIDALIRWLRSYGIEAPFTMDLK